MTTSLPVRVVSDETAQALIDKLNDLAIPPSGEIVFPLANQSAFGLLQTVQPTPVLQTDFVYGLNVQLWNTPVVSGVGAAVDTNSSRLRLQVGTAANGYAYIPSRRPIRYRAGAGTDALFTPIFDTGAANNIQLWGIGSITDNAPYDGYFFGFNGVDFGICHYNRGTPTWTAQADWNGDKCLQGDGSFVYDPTKGTPVKILYPYLGYGDILFLLQVPATGRWTVAHVIEYANSTAVTQLSNPTLQFIGFSKNSGNTTNKIMYCGSVGIFISGQRSFIGNPRWAADVVKTGVTTEAAALSIKNCTSYNGVVNRGLIRLISVSFGTNSNTYGTLRFKVGVTLGGAPSFTTVNGSTANAGATITNGNSIASIDTAGTTVTGGIYIWNSGIGPDGVNFVDLTPFELFIAPGEVGTFSLSGAANLAGSLSVNWSEDI